MEEEAAQGAPTATDSWDKRFTSPAPWDHVDVSAYEGLRFALAIARRARAGAKGRADVPTGQRHYYAPLRKTYLGDPELNPGLKAVGLDGHYLDYDKDDYYAWRHKGLRWSKTRRFPKSRWTKDWDHNRDKKLAHRPVAKFYNIEGLGTKETIKCWVQQTTSGYFRGQDRGQLLSEKTQTATGVLGPGEYKGTRDLWTPKDVYCGTVKPSSCFESGSKRDLSQGQKPNGGGPRLPPRPVYVSSEEERIRVERELLHSRASSSLGKPAPEDWSRSRRGFTFGHDHRVTTAEQPSLAACNNSKHYVRIPLDTRARMEALANGTQVPAAIIVSTTAPSVPPDVEDDEGGGPALSWTHGRDDDGTAYSSSLDGDSQSLTQESIVMQHRDGLGLPMEEAAVSREAKTAGNLTQPRQASRVSKRAMSASAAASRTGSASDARHKKQQLRGIPLEGSPPPSSSGARSMEALSLFKQANKPQGPCMVLESGPSLLGPRQQGDSDLGPSANMSITSVNSTSTNSNSFLSTALQRALADRKAGGQSVGIKYLLRTPSTAGGKRKQLRK